MKLMEIAAALEGLPECPKCGRTADMEDTWAEYSGYLRFACKGCGYAGDALRYDAYAQSIPDIMAVYREGKRVFALPMGLAPQKSGSGEPPPVFALPMGLAPQRSGSGEPPPVSALPMGLAPQRSGSGEPPPVSALPMGLAPQRSGKDFC